jgi:hypothetical protein
MKNCGFAVEPFYCSHWVPKFPCVTNTAQ